MEDKSKFGNEDIFKEYKEEISKDKERYKAVLLNIFEKNGYIDWRIRKEIIEIWEDEWREEPNIYIDKLKVEIDKLKLKNKNIFKEYKEEIVKNKEKYKPVLLDIFEKDEYISLEIRREIIEIWEKEWKEEPNIYINNFKKEIDKLKFKDSNIFEKYKEEISKDKERYKPILLELLEEDKIPQYLYKEIIKIWEKDWGEEPIIKLNKRTINLDKLKFENDNVFEKYKEEIVNDKEKYKPILLELLKEGKIYFDSYEEIIEIWEEEWKEENIEIDKLKFYYYYYCGYGANLFKEYKEEIKRNKEKYRPVLLELLEENKIDNYIYKEIIELWEKDWKEEPNIEIDKLKFCNELLAHLFEEYKEEIREDKGRYKPVLLELLEEDKINEDIYKEIIELWEEDWKEEPNTEIDKLKFKRNNILKKYMEELKKDKERYKLILLELLEANKIEPSSYKNIIEIWEKDWKEEVNINIDRLKFYGGDVFDVFSIYKYAIKRDKERYKVILLELLKEEKIQKYIYEDIIEIWEKGWKEKANVEIDKLKFKNDDILKKYREEILKDKERYKPALLKSLEKEIIHCCSYESIMEIWEKEWKEKPNAEVDKLIFVDWHLNRDYTEYYEDDEWDDEDDEWDDEDDEDSINYEYYDEDYSEDNYYNALITKEIMENPERYKPALLKILEANIEHIIDDLSLCPSVVRLWEWEWKEEPNIYIDKLKFYNEDAFLDFEYKIMANPERYKPVLLELISNEDYDFYALYKNILDKWIEKKLGI